MHGKGALCSVALVAAPLLLGRRTESKRLISRDFFSSPRGRLVSANDAAAQRPDGLGDAFQLQRVALVRWRSARHAKIPQGVRDTLDGDSAAASESAGG